MSRNYGVRLLIDDEPSCLGVSGRRSGSGGPVNASGYDEHRSVIAVLDGYLVGHPTYWVAVPMGTITYCAPPVRTMVSAHCRQHGPRNNMIGSRPTMLPSGDR